MRALSLSARRAWIEIRREAAANEDKEVALRKESVDRNLCACPCRMHLLVALRKESVDRNRAEGVKAGVPDLSLSARRAWIEILTVKKPNGGCWSLSARRAWIEISRVMEK